MATDGLAPVTYLFGATAPQEQAAGPSEPASAPSSSEGWYEEPGADSSGDRAPFGDRAQSRSGDEVAPPADPAAKTNLRHLPNFIENPDVPEVVIPAVTGETKSERRASNVSLNALARRGMSSHEMTKLLERRELETEDIEAEVARLEGAGLLDDAALAENLVRTLQERKGLGRSAISAELRRRKVDDEAISNALEAIDTDDELERAIEVATKRAGQLSSYDTATAKRRLGAYMQRRGYSGSILSQAMAAALDGTGGGGRGSGPRFS